MPAPDPESPWTGNLIIPGVENTGVKLDETLGKRYVAFKDPDRIAWEFYST